MATTALALATDGPEHNARGFFVIGPQAVNPSDVLAKLIGDNTPRITAADPREQRRAMRIYSSRHAQKMREMSAA